MISDKCWDAYMKMYPEEEYPNWRMIGLMPSGIMAILTEPKSRIQPYDETDKTFMERLSRCTPERNVFLEEWPEDTFDYENSNVEF